MIFIPAKYNNEMKDWLANIISAMPTENVSETVSEWATRKRVMPSGLSARPGPWSWNETPYLREIADCYSANSSINYFAFMKPTQIGATVGIIENAMGYLIEHGLGPQLFISGDQQMAEDSMATKVDDMIASAGLSDKIMPVVIKKNGKATGDRKDLKAYAGTYMKAVGPNSESKLRGFPAPYNHHDEVDVYPQTIVKNGQSTGNPLEKIDRRADSYGITKRMYYGSTPKESATSQIEPLYEQGDKREYRFECPYCRHKQKIKWKNLEWDKDKDGMLLLEYQDIDGVQIPKNDPVYLVCESDKKCKIRYSDKYDMLIEKNFGGTAEWVPTKKPDRPNMRSYHINALYGFRTWIDIVLQWQRVKDDPLLLPDFINDVLGETWKDTAEKPDEHELMQYAEDWPIGFINKNVVMLTLGVDVQKDRLECMMVGWARQRQSYVIQYWTLPGNPALLEDKCWNELDKIISADYMKEDGEILRITITGIDQQFLTETVNAFCDQFEYHRGVVDGVYPILARESINEGLVKKLSGQIATPILAMSDQPLKKMIYGILKKRKPRIDGTYPHSYIHFSKEYNIDFYKQLVAEEYVTERDKYKRMKTIIVNSKQRRNEVLDTFKYNFGVFQYAVSEFFDAENKKRRADKKREIEMDLDLFFDVLEGVR